MKKKSTFLGLLMFVSMFSSLFITSCKQNVPDDSFEDSKDIGISITLPSKTNRAVYYDLEDVKFYGVTVSQGRFNIAYKHGEPGETVKFSLTEYGDYQVTVYAYSDEHGQSIIAKGYTLVTINERDGYKNVTVNIEPEIKSIGIYAKAVWGAPIDGCHEANEAKRYDVTISENEYILDTYENIDILDTNYTINISWYGTYTIKVEAKDENQKVVGIGESIFTISKGDIYKDVTVTIIPEEKGAKLNVNINFVDSNTVGYHREKIQFGEWPQSLAEVESIILEETGKTYDGHIEYIGNDGEKYVEVYGSYFKVEPMTWRIIEYNPDGSKKLLADKIYTSIAFYGTHEGNRTLDNKTIYPDNYKYSNVRAYLNGINNQFVTDGGTATEYDIDWTDAGFFSSAFNTEEKKRIKDTVVDNSVESFANWGYCFDDPEYNAKGCENTIDKVFLLSDNESTRNLYGFTYNNDKNKVMEKTDYSSYTSYSSEWLLRSPCTVYENRVSSVDSSGMGGGVSHSSVSDSSTGVVPVIVIMP